MTFFFPANFGFFSNINEIIKLWDTNWRATVVTRIYEKASTANIVIHSFWRFPEMLYGIQTLYEAMHWIDSCCVDYWLTTDTEYGSIFVQMTDLTTSCCMGSWRFFIFTMRTEPLFCCWHSAKPSALQMKPLNGTIIPFKPEHHTKFSLLAQAV